MPYLEHSDLINAEKLIEIAKFNEAIQLLNDFSENTEITHSEQISYYILMCFLSIKIGKKQELFKYVEKAYQAIQGQKDSLQKLDVYIVKAISIAYELKLDKALKFFFKK